MNRRQWIQLIAAGGASAAIFGLGARYDAAGASYFLCTSSPDADLKRLFRAVDADPLAYTVTTRLAPAFRHDLAVLSGATLRDPAGDKGLPTSIAALANALRRRGEPARYLLIVEPREQETTSAIVIEQDGVLREVIDPKKPYRRIDVGGPCGRTTFRLHDGRLSVVEASCRHRNCRNVGEVSLGRIVCAPNRLVATLPHAKAAYDFLAG